MIVRCGSTVREDRQARSCAEADGALMRIAPKEQAPGLCV
eukprot:CAMPEP_0179021326 /NCGR_PEP_ID=MMETSP0796-20121207/5830_1 /TAXON_ID=73915 /ORGANISM="Pyrodinium bahamense, Strain pbaha01" /LENGTH=39 /DNA_ID= /DNA_START= /DNA_END= /DNA_ORIENTATION=